MEILQNLEPKLVWSYFEQICKVPRPSKKEEKIIEFLVEFAKKNALEYDIDNTGNVLIKKGATAGYENLETVVLQSHMDMVCEKNNDKDFNFDTDAIEPIVDGNWVKANGTTLGADDGIGVAAQMAILVDRSIEHGPVECLFTIDEETGLTGAFALESNFFKGKYLLNLDSEDEGELFIGCAGGIDTVGTLMYKTKKNKSNKLAFKVDVTGLKGGHSGDEINKGLGNSIKIIARFMLELDELLNAGLYKLEGGNLRNAIPREAFAIFTIDSNQKERLTEFFNRFVANIKNELKTTELNLDITLTETDSPKFVLKNKSQYRFINALNGIRHGVIEMSRDIPGLVETSNNLASVKFIADDKIEVTTSQRSSVESARDDAAQTIASVLKLAKAEVIHGDGYPGWQPNTDSEILEITKSSYEKLFKTEPVVRAIHAGLECGLFLEKYPYLDMISFGPTIRNAHSPEEKIDIETTQKFWELLLDVLKKIPQKK